MSTLVWCLPVLAAIALVLGGCRAETPDRILPEAGRSFAKLLGGLILLGLVMQGLLWAIPRIT